MHYAPLISVLILHAHTHTHLCSFQDEVMDADLLVTGQTETVFTDEGDGEGLTVHGFFPTGPVCKLILRLQKSTNTLFHYSLYSFNNL